MSDVDNAASDNSTSEGESLPGELEREVVVPVPDEPVVAEAPSDPAPPEPVVASEAVAVHPEAEPANVEVTVAAVSSDAPVAVEPVTADPVVADPVVAPSDPVAAVPAEPVPDPASFKYQPGDIVPGSISQVGANGIEADLGDGDIAVIPRAEIDGDPEVGQAIEGLVMKHQGGTGRYVISPKRAAKARAWIKVLDAYESKTPLTGKVIDSTKGGVIVDLGLRAFLPESLIDVRKPGNVRALIGTEVTVMVIECEKLSGEAAAKERRSEKIVVNRKILREGERKALRDRLLQTLQPGDRMTGTVTALTDFGAFVDLGGAEGLVHVSELAHRNVAKPSDVLSIGQDIDVIVLDVKADKGKISLSHKATLASPWQLLQERHKVGDLVFGNVTSLAAFGAFVLVEGEGFTIEGLIHVSELSRYRVESPAEVVNVGEGVWTKILAIEPDKRRLSLSLRRALEE
jgi:small subunit ribosomal protein S1